ncbi:MAG: bifunctional lysylphosphatidylglycerol flippase/synthetase MprF [Gemmatimonadaceae bacterium]|nr:bifunctional lysylphosphatidylglycerol flippase/synthetase MprF [Gemmatimonadaceae bacterium]
MTKEVQPTWKRWARRVGVVIVALGGAALVVGVWRRELATMRSGAIAHALSQLAWSQLVAAAALTIATYLLLPAYDLLALRYVRQRIGTGRAVLAATIAYGISHTLGFAAVTGNAVRARFWSSWGLGALDIAVAAGFAGFTFVLAITAVAGVALVGEPPTMLAHLPFAAGGARAVGVVALVAVALYLVTAWRYGGREVTLGARRIGALSWPGRAFRIPSLWMALGQVALGFADWLAAAGVLYALLPAGSHLSLWAFTSAFVLAQLVGLVSHVPGGLGVFETLMIWQLHGRVATGPLLGALVAYRFIFYFAPFAMAVGALSAFEAWRRRHHLRRAAGAVRTGLDRWARALLPSALGIMTLCGGAMLLVSGATPAAHGRLRMLIDVMPLGIVELSHFAGSVVGASLLVIGWGLTRKLDAAWTLACALLAAGIAASLLKGFDYEEAIALAVLLAILLPNHELFHRRSSFTREPLSAGWILSIAGIVVASIVVGVVSFRHVEFTQDQWWRFAVRGDAPRFLRASVGVSVTLGVMGLLRLLRYYLPEGGTPDAQSLTTVRAILAQSANVEGNLALLGDKEFLVAERGDAFLMYAVRGRSFVALHEPIGNPRSARELILRFMALADRAGGWPVLYEIGPDHLPLCIELGFSVVKLGEEAFVPLADFTLEGGRRKNVRRSHREAQRGGATFEIVARGDVDAVLADLELVSDAWLEQKATHEKGFSLGVFDAAYLRNFDIAVVRVAGRVVAFANILTAGNGDFSVDLMRYDDDGPDGLMDFLFAELMLWAKANGFRRMSLGIAPLSGLEPHAFATRWTRLAALMYRHGEPVYNFQGLRRYKEKFDPTWEPRYLATTSRLALPRVLLDVMTLISGGVRALVSKG